MDGSRSTALYGEEQLRVPKIAVSVEIVLDGGRRFVGDLHLATAAGSHLGRERVIDLLDAPEPFLPITVPGSGGHLLAKDRIVMVRVNELHDAGFVDDGLPVTTTRVEIGLASLPQEQRHLRGTIAIAMPPGKVRLLDYLNEVGAFFPVALDDTYTVLLARRYMVHVSQFA
jgi:hypothetical protein